MVRVRMQKDAIGCMFALLVLKLVSQESSTRHLLMIAPRAMTGITGRGFSSDSLSTESWGVKWDTGNFIEAHKAVKASGKFNFEYCKIPIPTPIRYDRIEDALGDEISPKEQRVLSLLKFGMPIDCNPAFGVNKHQKNHFSAVSFKDSINEYISKGVQSQAILGPFEQSPITDLCYSPLMSVPKEETRRRVIVDFSFPPGRAINDGISKSTYLEFEVDFCLPSVQSMVSRLNELGVGCLLYKRDLKGAFRQFSTDPGDYSFAGMFWDGVIFIDTRLAMGLRSASYCCQSVTEIIAKIVGKKAHILVYLDDFGGAELADKANASFNYLGWVLKYCGLEEAPEKAVPPCTKMDWLGVSFDTVEWTMAIKPSKLLELLDWLPKLLKYKRIIKHCCKRCWAAWSGLQQW